MGNEEAEDTHQDDWDGQELNVGNRLHVRDDDEWR